jgi:Ca2+-binding EF-hand superfamily protein
MEALFNGFDADRDGKLSYDEFLVGIRVGSLL